VEPNSRAIGRANRAFLGRAVRFLADADDPCQVVATLRDALAPGSYLVLCHGTDEGKPTVARAAEKVYSHGVSSNIHMRSRTEIMRFFEGFEVVAPGLVPIPNWRPTLAADAPSGSGEFWGGLAGVARKP
jgi:hypothetical protein